MILTVVGSLWVMGASAIPPRTYLNHAQFFSLLLPMLWQGGFLFFLYARRDLQPSAERLLEGDHRAAILLLRSFVDDEKVSYQSADFGLIDFSLESRLAAHFGRIGPFIAIASPNDKSLQIGAARALLSEAEWQNVVLEWMDRAQLLILMAGVTHWVEWELCQVVARGYTRKLIVMFPQIRKRSEVAKNAGERLARLRAAFEATPYADPLASLDLPEHIRALRFGPEGHVEAVTSKTRNRDSYHLGALVAHYLMLRASVGKPADAALVPA